MNSISAAIPLQKLELPSEMRRLAFAQIEPIFLAVLMLSFAFHFALAAYCLAQPRRVEVDSEVAEASWKAVVSPRYPIPKFPSPQSPATTGKPNRTDKPPIAAKAPTSQKNRPTEAQVRERIKQAGLLVVLGAQGKSGLTDVISEPVTDLFANALDRAKGPQTASIENIRLSHQKGNATGESVGIEGISTKGNGEVKLNEKTVTAIVSRVDFEPPEVNTTEIDLGALTRFVNSRKGSIVGCYEAELKRTPSLKGKIVLHFNITPSGRTSEVEIDEDMLRNDALAACLISKIRGWKLPFTPTENVPISYPFVFAPVQ
jgi:hypothetical protein